MTATIRKTNNRRRSPIVGERRELRRYSTPRDGQRLLIGQRVNGWCVWSTSAPAATAARISSSANSSTTDTRRCRRSLPTISPASKLAAIPLIPLASSPLERYLEHLSS